MVFSRYQNQGEYFYCSGSDDYDGYYPENFAFCLFDEKESEEMHDNTDEVSFAVIPNGCVERVQNQF